MARQGALAVVNLRFFARGKLQTVDLALSLATLEQRDNGGLQMQLQDVHSPCPSLLRRSDDNVLPRLASGPETATTPLGHRSGWGILKWPQVEEFGWPSGLWQH